MSARPAGSWYLAPAADHSDEWAAGYDTNVFASRDEAEAAIADLRRCGDDFARTQWVAIRREVRS